jgi:hypothetical protein
MKFLKNFISVIFFISSLIIYTLVSIIAYIGVFQIDKNYFILAIGFTISAAESLLGLFIKNKLANYSKVLEYTILIIGTSTAGAFSFTLLNLADVIVFQDWVQIILSLLVILSAIIAEFYRDQPNAKLFAIIFFSLAILNDLALIYFAIQESGNSIDLLISSIIILFVPILALLNALIGHVENRIPKDED